MQKAMWVLEKVCRLGLGGLFIYSAWVKIEDPGMFADSVGKYEVLPESLVGLFSLVMPMLELVAGIALVFTKWMREAALLISGMLALFMVALAQALARGLEISCGCFGVPSVGGRQEIVLALVRDMVLIVPAIWLMFRRNVYICSRLRPQAVSGLMAAFALAFALPASALTASKGPVRPGEWNLDFTNVLATARRDGKPMVLLQVGEGCSYCKRLEQAIDGEAFRLWREDRAPLMAYVRNWSVLSSPEVVTESRNFIDGISTNLPGYPYVCVYLPKGGKTNSVAFSGRRKEMERMGVKKNKMLVVEFMSALDRALAGANGQGGKMPLSEIIKKSGRKVSVKAVGEGSVSMSPRSGALPEGGEVTMSAKPKQGNIFVGWWRPDGKACGWSPKLTVRGSMPAGCYEARFRHSDECRPPVVLHPPAATLNLRVWDVFKHPITVDESCRPVSFRVKGRLPAGVKLNQSSGVLSGRLLHRETNEVDIAVIGADPAKTEKRVKVTFLALAPRQGAKSIDDEEDLDDGAAKKHDDAAKKKEDGE